MTEATLSFLGLGVKFPFASWGNIINDVNNAFVMTNYLVHLDSCRHLPADYGPGL